jgi:hypothetical protein
LLVDASALSQENNIFTFMALLWRHVLNPAMPVLMVVRDMVISGVWGKIERVAYPVD